MADPHSSGHYQGNAAVSQKRTIVDAAAGSGSAVRPAAAAKRPCFPCTCSGPVCYCGATTAAAAIAAAAAAAAAVSRDQHGAAQSGRPDSKWCSIAPPAASSPSTPRLSATVASFVTSSRAPGTSGQYTVANTMIASPRHVGNHALHRQHLQTQSTQHQHRHHSGNSGCSSSGTSTFLRAAAAAAPPSSVSSSASEIINDLVRSAVATSARPSQSAPVSSAGLISARPRAAGGAEVQVNQATSLPMTVVWPAAANGSSPSTPGTVMHYVPGSLGDIRQQAATSATNRLVAERRLFRCTVCDYFTTQQHKLAAHTEFYHSGKARAVPAAGIRMTPGVGQTLAAAATVSAVNCGMGSRAVLSSPPATVPAVDTAFRNMSVAMATGRTSHTQEHRADATFRGGLTPHGSSEPSALRAAMMNNASGSVSAGLPSSGMQVWWPPTPGSKPLNVPAGPPRVEATRPQSGTISCPFCSFKATLPNLLQLHIANRHGGIQASSNSYQRSSSHPASHITRIADILPTVAAISPQTAAPVLPQAAAAAAGKTANGEGNTISRADHDDPDVIITSWTISPAATAMQSSRLPPAPATAAASATSPSESAISLATAPAAAQVIDRQFANVLPETLPLQSSDAANSVIDPLPLSCRSKPQSPLLLLQSPASVSSAGFELVQQLSSSDRRPLSELLPPGLAPPPPLLLPSPTITAPAEVELMQLSNSDRLLLSELPSPEIPIPGIPIPSQASYGAIGSQSLSLPVATHTSMTSAGVAAERLSVAGVANAFTFCAGDSPAAATVASLQTVAEPSPLLIAAVEMAEKPCVASAVAADAPLLAVAADAPLHAVEEPTPIVDESHAPQSAVFTWEDLVSVGMDCAPLDEHRGSSSATATSVDASAATEKMLKVEQQPSPGEGSLGPSYFWSERLMLGELLFEDCDDTAATSGQLPGADEKLQKRSDESVSAAGAVDACRAQSESVNQLQGGLDQKLQLIGVVAGGDGGATSAQGAAARSSDVPWSDVGEGCVFKEAPAAGDCIPATIDGVVLVHAGPLDAQPSSSSCADAGSGGSSASSEPAPSAARSEAAEPAAAGEHPCNVLPALPQDKVACAAELGEPIIAENGEYSAASAASSSPGGTPLVSVPTSLEQQSTISSIEQQAAYLPNGRSMACFEETKPEILNVFTAKSGVSISDNVRDPDDSDRALMSLKADMLPDFSADGMQGLLKQDHETGVVVSSVISGHSHDMMQTDHSSSRSRSVDTAEEGAPSHAADGCYRSGIEPLVHNDKSLPTEDVDHSRDGGKETTSFSSPGPAVATRQRRLQQRQQLTNVGSSSSPSLVGNRERPAKRRSCLLAMDRVRETSACRKHKMAKGTSRSAAEVSSTPPSAASKLRRLVKHSQPRCDCCVSPAVGRSGSRATASRLDSAKKRQCSKRHAVRAASTRRRCSI